MPVLEVSFESLAEMIGEVHVPCSFCEQHAVMVVRCRVFPDEHALLCAHHFAKHREEYRFAALRGHDFFCPGCNGVSVDLHELVEFVPLGGGAA